MTYRVVPWATGATGSHALRAILAHPFDAPLRMVADGLGARLDAVRGHCERVLDGGDENAPGCLGTAR